jgi:hypothetical protein
MRHRRFSAKLEEMSMTASRSPLFLSLIVVVAIAFFFALPSHAQDYQVDLSSTSNLCGGADCFNTAGLFTTGTQFLGTTGLDNGNNCTPTAPYTNCPDAYSSNQLGLSSSTPPTLTPSSLNVPFTFGPVNSKNCGPSTSVNCTVDVINFTGSGVQITLPSDKQVVYSTMIILGTSLNGSHGGTITVTYTDSTTNATSQTFSDWCGYGANQNESIAVGGINRINSDGTLNSASCNLYAYTIPLDVTRELQSITLTDTAATGTIFAMAVTLKPPSYTIDGGAANPTSVAVGANSTATVTINPQPGYVGTVNLSCAISPSITTSGAATAPTCSLSPTSVTVTAGESSAPTTTLTFTAAKAAQSSMLAPSRKMFYAFLAIPGLALTGFGFGSRASRRQRLFGWLMLTILVAGVLMTPGCVTYKHLGNVGTPPGQYTVSVTGLDENGLTQASNPTGTSNTVIVTVTQ